MATMVAPTNAEHAVMEAVRECGERLMVQALIPEVSRRTHLSERAVRAIVWALIAQGQLDLANRHLVPAY
ncbi:MAG: hypothetical protein ACJ713_15175 [Candidatus Sulfotelmatobacter sp.]